MKNIAVLTSGGDAPGMNAAIRTVVRCGLDQNWNVYGIKHGYFGLIAGNFIQMGSRDVSGIVQAGGTILGSARCPEFETIDGRLKAIRSLSQHNVDALIVIGGNGSQTGAYELNQMGFPVVGIASTIDNDLVGSEITIGVDTALNIALEAIDRLKVTASSHQRAILVEVMGRKCGYLALMSALAGGAEAVAIPEVKTDPEEMAIELRLAYERGKAHALIIVAEGADYNAEALVKYFKDNKERLGFDIRATTLGHVQRGGAPQAFDRILASRLAAGAVHYLAKKQMGVLVGVNRSEVTATPYSEIVGRTKQIDLSLLDLMKILAK